MRSKSIIIIGTLLALLIACFFYNKYRIAPELEFNSIALTDLEGNHVNLDSFKDKNLFINFFATWCAPCMQEMPSFAEAQSVLTKNNFQFIFISDEPLEQLQNFSNQTGNRLIILHSEEKLKNYKIATLPTSYVLNSSKQIVFKKVGIEDWASQTVIEKLKEVSGK